MFSQNVTMSQTLLFASAFILTQLVSVAPGGFGVRQAIVTAVATTLGFDPGVSLVAVGLDRLVITIVIITGWISTIILGKHIGHQTVELVLILWTTSLDNHPVFQKGFCVEQILHHPSETTSFNTFR